MNGRKKPGYFTLAWTGRALRILDQTRLPGEEVYLDLKSAEEVWEAIRKLRVRGAPALGVAAAYGLYLGLRAGSGAPTGIARGTTLHFGDTSPKHIRLNCGEIPYSAFIPGQSPGPSAKAGKRDQARSPKGRESFLEKLREVKAYLETSRPTAVNLFAALRRVEKRLRGADFSSWRQGERLVLAEAKRIEEEDRLLCDRIAEAGRPLVPDRAAVLTHCNAGALATAGIGTALGVIFRAAGDGKKISVFADETRPLLQGSRLTVWELRKRGIETTLICDNMAGWMMRRGRIDLVLVGADRIAANGDTANKIGTYSLAILARHHRIPFYVAAPATTFDLSLADGGSIPIEERCGDEVAAFAGKRVAPAGIKTCNPAFDVTPASLITAFITDRGVIRPPYTRRKLPLA